LFSLGNQAMQSKYNNNSDLRSVKISMLDFTSPFHVSACTHTNLGHAAAAGE
jgi:hypothetical protein